MMSYHHQCSVLCLSSTLQPSPSGGSRQNETAMERETITRVCVLKLLHLVFQVREFVLFFVVCQGPWQRGTDYAILMAQMQP